MKSLPLNNILEIIPGIIIKNKDNNLKYPHPRQPAFACDKFYKIFKVDNFINFYLPYLPLQLELSVLLLDHCTRT